MMKGEFVCLLSTILQKAFVISGDVSKFRDLSFFFFLNLSFYEIKMDNQKLNKSFFFFLQ